MSVSYKYIERPKDIESAIDFMQNDLMPLFNEYWEKHGKGVYKKDLSFNIQAFVQMWMLGGMMIIMAYEDKKAVGFLLGILFTPLPFQSNVVQAEKWYARDPQVEKGLYEYLMDIIKFKDIDEVWVLSSVVGTPHIPWPKKNSFLLDRYVKD